MRALLLSALLLLLAPALAAQSAATYRVDFVSTWSAETHPGGFPPNPHFSGLVGATHDGTAGLWAPGALASDGIEQMAETGSKSTLLAEVDALRAAGRVGQALSGDFMGVSPGAVSMTFGVSESHPLVSLVTMLAPSPDWFVGVHDLDLFAGGAWAGEIAVPLLVYDAGTDSGPSYTSPDQNTNPAAPIFLIEEAPFFASGEVLPIGLFTFTVPARQ